MSTVLRQRDSVATNMVNFTGKMQNEKKKMGKTKAGSIKPND